MTVHRTRADRQAAVSAGIMRHIVGANRVAAHREAKQRARAPVAAKVPEVAQSAPAAPVAPPAAPAEPAKRRMRISDDVRAAAKVNRKAAGQKVAEAAMASGSWLEPWQPPKGVLPAGSQPVKLAMDLMPEGFVQGQFGAGGGWAGDALNVSFAEGIGFLGYSYLAALTQRAEYRRISERIATEMTRKWIRFQTVNKPEDYEAPGPEPEPAMPAGAMGVPADPEEAEASTAEADAAETKQRVQDSIARKRQLDKTKRIKELEDELKRLRVKDAFYTIAEGDGWFGRYHLYLDFGVDDNEDQTPIGNGVGAVSEAKVGPEGTTRRASARIQKRKLVAVRPIEPMWCYPANYNSLDPRKPDWYNPEQWYVNGKTVHRSRLLRFVGREVPDILKPAYAFGGLSMSQMAKPYVDNWLRTRQAVCDLIESFSVSGIYTNLAGVLEEGNAEAMKRVDIFNDTRANAGAWVLDKETEEFFNVSTPLGSLDKLQAQSQEQMSSVSGIPLIILLGITPTGLNASSEGEIRSFYDTIAAFQEQFFRDHLQTVINFVMLSLWGEVDDEIRFDFVPLWSMTEKELAEIRKIEAETDGVLIDKGVITNAESRNRVANDPDSQYHDINPADVPEMPEPDMGGDDPFGGGDGGGDGGDGGEADGGFGGASDEHQEFLAFDEWNEGDHPRGQPGNAGQFAKGSGGGGKSDDMPDIPDFLKKKKPVGGIHIIPLGSKKSIKGTSGQTLHEGGQYEDADGNKFYVKKPKTKEHVANEKAAARLYQLAGVNTLDYVDAGPDHVVTRWEQLDKNRISKMTDEERKAATKDFGVHAWLSNWDAAGTGGDNQGVRNGEPVTLDVGGSLRYRAQGGPKGSAFGKKVSEIDTMRDPGKSPDAAKLYGKMSDADLKESVSRVTNIPDAKIRAAVGDDTELADILIARKQDLAKRFGVQAQDEAMMAAAMDAIGANLEDDGIVGNGYTWRGEEDPGAGEDLSFDGESVSEVAPDVFAFDEGHFDESKVKRDKDGKFAEKEGGGEGGEEGEKAEADKPKTKKEQIGAMLLAGTTPKELMTAMGWPSVSMPAQAAALGMKLTKKDGKYFGTKMTDEELAAFKEEQIAKKAAKMAGVKLPEAQSTEEPKNITETATFKKAEELNKKGDLGSMAGQPAPKLNELPKGPADGGKPKSYSEFLGALAESAQSNEGNAAIKEKVTALFKNNPEFAKQYKENAKPEMVAKLEKQVPGIFDAPKPKAPQASPDDIAKAKKSVALQMQYVKANAKPETATYKKMADELLEEFNSKWTGKEGLTNEQLNEKVQDFKNLGAAVTQLAQVEGKQKAEIVKAEQEKAAWEAKKAAEKEKADLAEAFAKDPELKTHYEAMEALFGGGKASANYLAHAAKKLKSSGYAKHLTPEGAVPIIAYSGSHYAQLNAEVRKGVMSVEQYKFMKSLNQALDKLPAYDGVTYRKAPSHSVDLSLYQPGKVVEERGFTSTSKNKGTWHGDVQYTIHGKSGRDIQSLSSHPGEAEVLFKSGARFYVESKQGNHIVLREL